MNKRPQKLEVSKHATKRCRKRMGVPKKAVVRMAKKALEVGKRHTDYSGSFHQYLNAVCFKEGTENNICVYNLHLFIFADSTLITAWPVPPKYRKTVLRQAGKAQSSQILPVKILPLIRHLHGQHVTRPPAENQVSVSVTSI